MWVGESLFRFFFQVRGALCFAKIYSRRKVSVAMLSEASSIQSYLMLSRICLFGFWKPKETSILSSWTTEDWVPTRVVTNSPTVCFVMQKVPPWYPHVSNPLMALQVLWWMTKAVVRVEALTLSLTLVRWKSNEHHRGSSHYCRLNKPQLLLSPMYDSLSEEHMAAQASKNHRHRVLQRDKVWLLRGFISWKVLGLHCPMNDKMNGHKLRRRIIRRLRAGMDQLIRVSVIKFQGFGYYTQVCVSKQGARCFGGKGIAHR